MSLTETLSKKGLLPKHFENVGKRTEVLEREEVVQLIAAVRLAQKHWNEFADLPHFDCKDDIVAWDYELLDSLVMKLQKAV